MVLIHLHFFYVGSSLTTFKSNIYKGLWLCGCLKLYLCLCTHKCLHMCVMCTPTHTQTYILKHARRCTLCTHTGIHVDVNILNAQIHPCVYTWPHTQTHFEYGTCVFQRLSMYFKCKVISRTSNDMLQKQVSSPPAVAAFITYMFDCLSGCRGEFLSKETNQCFRVWWLKDLIMHPVLCIRLSYVQ